MGNKGGKPSKADALQHAEKTGVLQMRNCKIKEIPGSVLNLKDNLRNLDLSENKIEVIPGFIGHFQQLKQLNVSANHLTSLPDELGQLSKLETLTATNNKITHIPASFANLTNLKKVELSENALKEFPVVFCQLRKLDLLDVSGNRIQTIPAAAATLPVLELNMNRNALNSIAPELADAPRLKILRVEENCLSIEAFSSRLLKNSNIYMLSVSGNVFDEKDLRTLDGYEDYMERFTANKKKMY